MSVSVVMPCYNEEKVIGKVIRDYYDGVVSKLGDSELIVVDDASRDSTPRRLAALQAEYPRLRVLEMKVNQGHGRALRAGYEAACKEWVFQVDSDNQFDAEEYWKLDAVKENYDFILGFREKRLDSPPRKVLSKMIRLANRILFGVWLEDANCPFRLIQRESLEQLLGEIDPAAVAPNIMMAILGKRNGLKMAEVPVTHRARAAGTGSLGFWKLILFLWRGFWQLVQWKIKLSKIHNPR